MIGRRLSEELETGMMSEALTAKHVRAICEEVGIAFGFCWIGQLRNRQPDWLLCFAALRRWSKQRLPQSHRILKTWCGARRTSKKPRRLAWAGQGTGDLGYLEEQSDA